MNKYIESQARAAGPVTIDNLICKNCKFRGDGLPTAVCIAFPTMNNHKPTEVLLGGNCPEYKEG